MEKAKNIILAVLSLLLVLSIGINVKQCGSARDEPYCDTLRVTFVDTIPYYNPVPRDSVVVRYVTAILPVDTSGNNEPQIIPDFGNIAQDNIPDSAAVVIPITQKVYGDSTYRAYVSGYRPRLDSIFVFPEREVVTISQKAKPKRWGIGIHAGYGVGKDGLSPYLGIGVSYNLFGF